MKNQQNSSKGEIKSELSFEGNYNDYYRRILNDYNAYEKTKFDLLTFKNAKYLVYCFNDFLKTMSQPTIKIKHSKVTDDCIAAEEIQNSKLKILLSVLQKFANQKKLVAQLKDLKTFYLLQLKM